MIQAKGTSTKLTLYRNCYGITHTITNTSASAQDTLTGDTSHNTYTLQFAKLIIYKSTQLIFHAA